MLYVGGSDCRGTLHLHTSDFAYTFCTAATPAPNSTGDAVGRQDDLELRRPSRTDRGNRSSPGERCGRSGPSCEPCPFAMTEPKRVRNSLTITLESMPFGARIAVTRRRATRREQLEAQAPCRFAGRREPTAARFPPACPCRAS